MHKTEHQFSKEKVHYYFNGSFSDLETLVNKANTVIITDETVFSFYKDKLPNWQIIIIKAGEEHKQQHTANSIIEQLISLGADRSTTLVGLGGGVITDLTGYVASIYLRGVAFAFVPTTILAMVDASIGGKNGVDVGAFKNLVGTINQPKFILFNYATLNTLPPKHWVNGFAEIIKHATIKDIKLVEYLEQNSIEDFKNNLETTSKLIEKNVAIKTEIVINDEFETGNRKLLNFGHTFGHAIENTYNLLHGQAVSIGMVLAIQLSHKLGYLSQEDVTRIIALVEKYGLSSTIDLDKDIVWKYLSMDKKRVQKEINFILLSKLGEATIRKINMIELETLTEEFLKKNK